MRVVRWVLVVFLGAIAALAAALAINLLWIGVPPERELVFLRGAFSGSAGATYLTCAVVFVLAAAACAAVLRSQRRSKTAVEPRK
jgi:hypothetical protein